MSPKPLVLTKWESELSPRLNTVRVPAIVLLLLAQLLVVPATAQDGQIRSHAGHSAVQSGIGGHSFASRNRVPSPGMSASPEIAASPADRPHQPPATQLRPPSPVRQTSQVQFSEPLSANSSPDHMQAFPNTMPTLPGINDPRFNNYNSQIDLAPTLDAVTGSSGPREERQWSFNFHGAPWGTVLRTFAKDAGLTLQAISEPAGDFTYYDENLYNATETIDIFNDYLLASGQILVRDGNRLTLSDASGQIPDNMIPFIAIHMIDSLGRNELASVAIPLRHTDPVQAVEEIKLLQSPLGQVKALTNSGRVIVTDTGSYLRRMRDLLLGSGVAASDGQALVYQLRHAQAEDVAKAITDFLSQNSGPGSAGGDGSSLSMGSGDTSQRVVAEKTTNSLLVRGSAEEMGTLQRIIEDLDRAPREVLVQALLVEVELGNTNELGVELGFQDSVLFDRSVVDKVVSISQTTTAPNGVQTTNQSILSQTAAPGFNFNNQPLGNNIAANPNRIGPQGLSNLGVGRVNGDLGFGGLVLSAGSESVNLLLRALDAHFNIDVLSRPQVRAVENHEAFIQIGQQVPVVDGVAITPVGSANPVIRQDQAGIILKVTPRISPDGRVQLDVNAEKSAFNLAPGTGVPIFTDATNGNVIEAPIKDITTADTTVSIQSGQTIVLGGMITNDQTVVARKVPWLGDIPIIGRLFRYDLNRHKRKELLVFLTPTVLEHDGHADLLKAREAGLINMPAEAFSFGDNLTGTYGTPAESQFMLPAQHGMMEHPVEMPTGSEHGQIPSGPTSSGSIPSGPPVEFSPASRSNVPSAGHSSSIRQVSRQTVAGQPYVPTQNAGGPTGNSASQVYNAAQEQRKDKSSAKPGFWSKSPNFRGLGLSKKPKAKINP